MNQQSQTSKETFDESILDVIVCPLSKCPLRF